MWAQKLVDFQEALDQFVDAREELNYRVKINNVTDEALEHHRQAKLKVIQLFNEQLTANQKHSEGS